MKRFPAFILLFSIAVSFNAQEPISRAVNFDDMEVFDFKDTLNQTDEIGLKQGYWKLKTIAPNGMWKLS